MRSIEEFNPEMLIFKALSDPLRLQLLQAIHQKERVCVCKLTEKFGKSQSKLSYHLKMLLDAKLIDVFPEGRWNFYSIRMETFKAHLSIKLISKLFSEQGLLNQKKLI